MSVKGKKENEWTYATYTDFGRDGWSQCLVRHYSWKAALNTYQKLWKIYGKIHEWDKQQTHAPRVWIEKRGPND